ncbi:Y-family DNA polymerase [Sphingobacterium arenae]|uniref:DNA polymerase Y family protein n=1 Tax=Sphingobacterium arenae TaxID=1280598 RepID=A0ABR7XY85_9SPHI|nr:DNA polymerase Y family protein [Sphingobacterium arenae]MBD1424015.1 DNA polymerase Y family protein [Sphingobacterium arenae]
MEKRFASIWFPYLTTDRHTIRQPELRNMPFVLAAPIHGRMVITEANAAAEVQGVSRGMVVADAKACLPDLGVADASAGLAERLLKVLGLWCIRYTPVVAEDPPDGLILDISGCPHLWQSEELYLKEIVNKLQKRGFHARMAIAGTIGTAWAMARFGNDLIEDSGRETDALLSLPPAALRLEPVVVGRLHKLGLRTVGSFIHMPPSVLRRRFGEDLPLRLRQALGRDDEPILPLRPVPPYVERLPCLEPVRTATSIEIAIDKLLEALCKRLSGEGKGLRIATLKCHRVDGKTVQVGITTSRATASVPHLAKLFGLKVPYIEPALGIELFVLEASKVEDSDPVQEALWGGVPGLEDTALSELIDRLKGRAGIRAIYRYLPDEHHWPERSFKEASSITEKPSTLWKSDRPRPTRLLASPEPIEVTAPIPDYPPMLFRHKGETHTIKKADGPERIEREWWMDIGEHRDYYHVEDDKGRRYWLYRSGHYEDDRPQRWFLHGFFA